MSLTPMLFLIVCPLVFLAGFIDAIAGGGGLISLPAYMIAGLPVHNAIATNKISSAMGTAIATGKYAKNGYIRWKISILAVAAALCGSSLGARLALWLDADTFKLVMLVLLPLTAIYVLRKKTFETDKAPYSFWGTSLLCAAAAFVIGIYDGFYGPGTGTFLLLLLTGLVHMDLMTANGTTKLINLSTNLAALTVYLLNSKTILPLGLTAGLFSIAGNYCGAVYFEKGGIRSVKPVMILVLTIFFIKVIWEMFF